MRSALYLLPVLLFWPLSTVALPLPPGLEPELLPGNGTFITPGKKFPNFNVFPYGGPPRKPRSAEEPAEANAVPTLKSRTFEHSPNKPKAAMRRAVELRLSMLGKEASIVDLRALRKRQETSTA